MPAAHQRDFDIVPLQREHETLIRSVMDDRIVTLTQEEYDELTPDPDTIYVIVG